MDKKCQFCGENILQEQPYMVKKKRPVWGEEMFETKKDFCCTAQKRNQEFHKNRYDPTLGNVPDIEDVGKL